MKKFVLTILALTFAASPAFAQWGDIGAYNDQPGTSCNVADVGAGIHDIFILLKHNTGGAVVAKFRVELTGSTMSYVGETVPAPFVSIGSSQAGIEVGFTSCRTTDVYVMKVTYFGLGSSPPCGYFSVIAHPGSEVPGQAITVDCNTPFGNIRAVPGGQAIINPGPPPVQCDCSVATAETTWGSIKALYR
jgi:hypothetical protein